MNAMNIVLIQILYLHNVEFMLNYKNRNPLISELLLHKLIIDIGQNNCKRETINVNNSVNCASKEKKTKTF